MNSVSVTDHNPSHLILSIGQGGIQTFQSIYPRLTIDTESKTNADVQLSALGSKGVWEHGYHVSTTKVFDSLRSKLEKMDRYEGMYFGYATSGGTGSGLSARLLQELRDWLPKSYLIGLPILPFSIGENPLQQYNTIINLATFQWYADAILWLPNDLFLFNNQVSLKESSNLNFNFNSFNQNLCESIQPLLQMPNGVWDLLTHVCPMSELKFLHLSTSTTLSNNWLSIVQSLCQHPWISKSQYRPSCLSAAAYIPNVFANEDFNLLYRHLDRKLGFLNLSPSPLRCHVIKKTNLHSRLTSNLQIASNSQLSLIQNTSSFTIQRLSELISKVALQQHVNAYRHLFSIDGWETMKRASLHLFEVMEHYKECTFETSSLTFF